MTTRKNIVTATIVIAMLGLAVSAQAVVVTYELRVGGLAHGTGPGGALVVGDAGIAVGVPFQLEIWAKVTDNQYDVGGTLMDLGLFQYNVDIVGNAALSPTETLSGLPATPTGFWKSSSVAPMVNYPALVDLPTTDDVYQQAGQIPPANWGSNYLTFSVLSFSKVGEGEYTWDGSWGQTLTAVSHLGGNVVAAYDGELIGRILGDGDSVIGDSITFAVPEPSTLALLCMGVVGFLTYTRRRRKH